MKNKLLKNLLRFTGLLVLVILYRNLDWQGFGELIKNADYALLIYSFALNFLIIFTKSFRWKQILKVFKKSITNKDTFIIYTCGAFLGVISPGKLGDFLKVFYLQKKNISSLKIAFVSVVVDRVFDLIFIVLVGGLFVFFYSKEILFDDNVILWISISSMIILSILLLLRLRYRDLIVSGYYRLKEYLKLFVSVKALDLFGSTLLAYFFIYFQIFLIAKAIGMPVDVIAFIPVIAFAEMVSLLPISIAGIGTREAVLLFFLQEQGASYEEVMFLSIGIFFIVFVGTGLFGGVVWSFNPIEIDLKTIRQLFKRESLPFEH